MGRHMGNRDSSPSVGMWRRIVACMCRPAQHRSDGDSGDAVIVTVIIAIPLLILLGAFVLGESWMFTHNAEAFDMTAQRAVEASVAHVGASGNIGPTSVKAAVSNYMDLSKKSPTWRTKGGCEKATIVDDRGAKVVHSMPYMVITTHSGRSAHGQATQTWISEGGKPPRLVGPPGRISSTNHVISAVVYDSTRNPFAIGPFHTCQTKRSEVSAITFASNSDVDDATRTR